jgi:hypothetical protein
MLSWVLVPTGVVLLVIGGRRFLRASPFLAAFLALYLLVVVAWPYPPDRFVWGIWPLVTLALGLGLYEAAIMAGNGSSSPIAGRAIAICGAISVVGYLVREGGGLGSRSWEHSQAVSARAMEPAVRWVRAHVPDSVVVATVNDPMLYLYSGRQTVPVLSWSAVEHVAPQTVPVATKNLAAIVAAYRPGYVILPGGGTPEAFAAEQLWKEERQLKLVDTLSGGGAVFAPSTP